jgi:transcriptional regulator GlxA family with amidase domain
MTNVGILVFGEVEVLDFAGPFEVFSITEDETKAKLFRVFTVSQHDALVSARNGFLAKANYTIATAPQIDILIVPGGYGAEKIEINNATILQWIADTAATAEITASVCTGAFLLAKAGVIRKQTATTHWMDLDDLQSQYPDLTVVQGVKYVDNGKTLTSAGISAGIEMSLHLVARLHGIETANRTARRMDYDWHA